MAKKHIKRHLSFFFISFLFFVLTTIVVVSSQYHLRGIAEEVTDPVLVAAGDIACGSASGKNLACKQMATSDLILQMNPTAVLPLGDNQYEDGQLSDFNTYYDPSWGRVKAISYPVVGNHEYKTLTNASGYFDYFNGVGNQTGPAGDRTKGYYSYDMGNWHIIALNTNCSKVGGCGVGSPQEQWLRQDLATNQNKCLLMYGHHPLYSSLSVSVTTSVRPLLQAFYDYKGDVYLAGHAHNYERFAQQNANGGLDTTNGFREIVVGTGGHSRSGPTTAGAANSEVYSKSFGVLKFTLHPSSYSWDFVPVPGYTFTDSGTTSCHATPTTPSEETPTPTPTPTESGPTPTPTPIVFSSTNSLYSYRFISAANPIPNTAAANQSVLLNLHGNWTPTAFGVHFDGNRTDKQSVAYGKPLSGDTLSIPTTEAVGVALKMQYQAPAAGCFSDSPNMTQIGIFGTGVSQIKLQLSNCGKSSTAVYPQCRIAGSSSGTLVTGKQALVDGQIYIFTCAKAPDATAANPTVELKTVTLNAAGNQTYLDSFAINRTGAMQSTKYLSVANKYPLPSISNNTDQFVGDVAQVAYCKGATLDDVKSCLTSEIPE